MSKPVEISGKPTLNYSSISLFDVFGTKSRRKQNQFLADYF